MKLPRITLLAIIVLSCPLFPSCTMTVDPAGNKTYAVDSVSAMRAIEILAQK